MHCEQTLVQVQVLVLVQGTVTGTGTGQLSHQLSWPVNCDHDS